MMTLLPLLVPTDNIYTQYYPNLIFATDFNANIADKVGGHSSIAYEEARVSIQPNGKFGNCVKFAGTISSLTQSRLYYYYQYGKNLNFNGDFTLSFWLRIDGNPITGGDAYYDLHSALISSIYDYAGMVTILALNNGVYTGDNGILFNYRSNGGRYDIHNPTPIIQSEWTHISITRKNSVIFLGVGGNVVSSTNHTNIIYFEPYLAKVSFGTFTGLYSYDRPLNGAIDDVVFFDIAIDQFISNFTPPMIPISPYGI